MATTKAVSHTPGPWKAGYRSGFSWQIGGSDQFGPVTVAEVLYSPGVNAEANARLIAKAPEMLAIARLLLESAAEAAILLQDYEPALANWLIDLEQAAREAVAEVESV